MNRTDGRRRRSLWRTFALLSGATTPTDVDRRWMALVATRSPSPTSGVRTVIFTAALIAVARSVGVALTWGYLLTVAGAVWFAVTAGQYAGGAAPLSGDDLDDARRGHRDRVASAGLWIAAVWLLTLGLQRVAAR